MSITFDTITCNDRAAALAELGMTIPGYMRHEYTRTFAVPVTAPLGIRNGIEQERVYVGCGLLPLAIRESMEASGGVRLIIARP